MSRASTRFYRTIILGVLAMCALVWVAMEQFGISRGEIGELFLGALLAVIMVIGAAAIVALLWVGLRHLLGGPPD